MPITKAAATHRSPGNHNNILCQHSTISQGNGGSKSQGLPEDHGNQGPVQLTKGNIDICKSIIESRALLCFVICFVVLLKKGTRDVQYNSAMVLMEIVCTTKHNDDLRRSAFKLNSPTSAIIEQFLQIVVKGDNGEEDHRSVGSPAGRQGSGGVERSGGGTNQLRHLVRLVYHDEQMHLEALILFCYIAKHVFDSLELAKVDVFNTLSWAYKQSHLVQDERVDELLQDVKSRLELYQDADEGDRCHSSDAALPRLDTTPLSELADEVVADGDVDDVGGCGNRDGGGANADTEAPGESVDVVMSTLAVPTPMETQSSSSKMRQLSWKNVEDGQYHKKTVEDSRIFKFLTGLNVEFDEVRGKIIGRRPLPSLSEVFSKVRREESRRNVMLGKKEPTTIIEGSALTSTGSNIRRGTANLRKPEEKSVLWCDFCNKPRHTRETCWKIHGKPANFKSKSGEKNERIFPTTNEAMTTTSAITKEHLEQLLALLTSNSSSNTPNVSVAHTGNEIIAFPCGFGISAQWIIDSGASDHIFRTW
ncbi:hypothetical protein ZIOFF_044949 [Zingiber officinale]|uniref:Uncharacterized protein n=1 Tax=Zingiber officinale TaxID=94328 RepID=A0A8J5KRJ9_ZINOF|nr:hypothetical protein ZIOFF_044949 [Zingiber officinale]